MKKYLIVVLFVIAIILAIIFTPDDNFVKTGKFYINEVMVIIVIILNFIMVIVKILI